MSGFEAEAKGNVLTVRFEASGAGWEQWFLLSSDRHHDNLRCRRDLELAHLQLAKERGALIVDCGDLFCAMQGKWDPRSSLDEIRPEDAAPDYIDRIVVHAAEDYAPFAKNFLLLGRGNHEAAILDRHGIDLTSNLAHRLRQMGSRVFVGGYGGWIRIMVRSHRTVQQSLFVKYHHGSGGGNAPVTRGVIQTNRQAVYLPDADVVVNGHTHDAYHVPIARERVTQAGRVTRDIIHFVRTPTYKDEYGEGAGGWAVQRGTPPKPLGCVWMRLWLERNRVCVGINLDVV